jgi:parallel beta-helix repeat protein
MVGSSPASGAGIWASDSQITLRGNTIQRFLNGFEARQVRGEIHGNTFVQNGYGIWLRAGDLNIAGNTFLMNANAAISLVRHSYPSEKPLSDAPVTARITHNTISSNSLFGISLMDKAEADIRYNLIEGNSRGIDVEDSSAKIINNTIVLQKLRGIELKPKSRAEVYNNIVAFNCWGIVVDVAAQWSTDSITFLEMPPPCRFLWRRVTTFGATVFS